MLIRRTVTPKRVLVENILLNPEVFFQAGILPITIPIPICLLLSRANCSLLILSLFLTLNNDASAHFSAGKIVAGACTARHCSPPCFAINYRSNFWALLEVRKKHTFPLNQGLCWNPGEIQSGIYLITRAGVWGLMRVFLCSCVLVINDVFVKVSICLDSSCLIFLNYLQSLYAKKRLWCGHYYYY